ncbi:hypothetical protein [Streptomyces sp. NPDC048659]|uniref:hypothetical protein n=1 Tax=Streptomyces sp. NPDC048659 TaxID=3155489 RepID=UPI003441A57F
MTALNGRPALAYSAVALGGFCVGVCAAGLFARRRVVSATWGASLGLAFAAVSMAFLTALPTGPLTAASVATALTALMAFRHRPRAGAVPGGIPHLGTGASGR